ncbi:MAG: YggS family pyridoxal phosphate-dependent enzyme [Magnetococcus sp. DMHC-8]
MHLSGSDVIAANLAAIRQRMAAACRRSGRDPQQVRLLAVSKTQPVSMVQAAVAAGQWLFGENRVMEARDKITALAQSDGSGGAAAVPLRALQWHLIGPLQRNKAKVAAGLFQMIHSVDSLPLAEALAMATGAGASLSILLQVNVGREPQKSGVVPEEAEALARALARLPGLALCGLMAIPPQTDTAAAARSHFRALADLARHIDRQAIAGVAMTELSMGMSHDFEVAIEEGATWVRVGSALFGER